MRGNELDGVEEHLATGALNDNVEVVLSRLRSIHRSDLEHHRDVCRFESEVISVDLELAGVILEVFNVVTDDVEGVTTSFLEFGDDWAVWVQLGVACSWDRKGDLSEDVLDFLRRSLVDEDLITRALAIDHAANIELVLQFEGCANVAGELDSVRVDGPFGRKSSFLTHLPLFFV